MARQDFTGKNRGVGETRDFGRVGIDVVHPTNVQAFQRDPSQLVNALNQFNGMLREVKEQKKSTSKAEGMRAAALGQVDESRMATDEAFADGVNSLRVTQQGMRWMNETAQRIQSMAQDDPNFDVDQALRDANEEFLTGAAGQSPKTAEEQMRFVGQLEQNVRAWHSNFMADMRDYPRKPGRKIREWQPINRTTGP